MTGRLKEAVQTYKHPSWEIRPQTALSKGANTNEAHWEHILRSDPSEAVLLNSFSSVYTQYVCPVHTEGLATRLTSSRQQPRWITHNLVSVGSLNLSILVADVWSLEHWTNIHNIPRLPKQIAWLYELLREENPNKSCKIATANSKSFIPSWARGAASTPV